MPSLGIVHLLSCLPVHSLQLLEQVWKLWICLQRKGAGRKLSQKVHPSTCGSNPMKPGLTLLAAYYIFRIGECPTLVHLA